MFKLIDDKKTLKQWTLDNILICDSLKVGTPVYLTNDITSLNPLKTVVYQKTLVMPDNRIENHKVCDIPNVFLTMDKNVYVGLDGATWLTSFEVDCAAKPSDYIYKGSRNDATMLILDEDLADTYLIVPSHGDEVLDAILNGKQILIKTKNVGENDLVMFSPVLFIQAPVNGGRYIYLFYLKDEKQELDLSQLNAGTIQIPTYGQLKLILTETYYECPLK